jgi:hypothetical protein
MKDIQINLIASNYEYNTYKVIFENETYVVIHDHDDDNIGLTGDKTVDSSTATKIIEAVERKIKGLD